MSQSGIRSRAKYVNQVIDDLFLDEHQGNLVLQEVAKARGYEFVEQGKMTNKLSVSETYAFVQCF